MNRRIQLVTRRRERMAQHITVVAYAAAIVAISALHWALLLGD